MSMPREIVDRFLGTSLGESGYGVTEILMDAGYECWWVGGAVREMLLGNVPKEIDMATSATPEQVAALFKKCDESAALLGTVIVSHKGSTFEITTFREDAAVSDGRHPETVCFADIGKDALRRDATINAMYFNPILNTLFDPCGGETDITEKLVRLIGEPVTRLRHDALRILRLVRLRAGIGGQYHPETYTALESEAALTASLSGTRILQELEKLLKTPHPEVALQDLYDLKVLAAVLPELHACKGVAQPKDYHKEGDVFEHLKQCTAHFSDDHGPDVRLAALFHDCGKPQTFAIKERIRFDHHAGVSADIAKKIFTRFQMPSARIDKIHWMIAHHMMMGSFATLSVERKAYWYYHPWFKELLELFVLDIAGTNPGNDALYDSIVADYNEFLNVNPRPAKPLLNGEDIMKILGLPAGEQVGKALKALRDAQVNKTITTKAEAKEFLHSWKPI